MDIMPDSESRKLQDKFMLRLPDGMRDRIRAAAAENNRSMNAEIVAVLEERYPAQVISATDFTRFIAAVVNADDPKTRTEGVRVLNKWLGESGWPIEAKLDERRVILCASLAK